LNLYLKAGRNGGCYFGRLGEDARCRRRNFSGGRELEVRLHPCPSWIVAQMGRVSKPKIQYFKKSQSKILKSEYKPKTLIRFFLFANSSIRLKLPETGETPPR
jgi:hypothetical protein